MGLFVERALEATDPSDYFQICFMLKQVNGRSWERKHEQMQETCAWCEDQFGKPASAAHPNLPNSYEPWQPGRWWASLASVRFHSEIDAVAFKMRWC